MQPRPVWGLSFVTNIYNTAADVVVIPPPGADERIVIVSQTWSNFKSGTNNRIDLKDSDSTIFFRVAFDNGVPFHSESQYFLAPGRGLNIDVVESGGEIYGNVSYWLWSPGLPYQAGFF